MATGNHVRSVTNTLTGTTADVITLNQLWPAVEVHNHDADTPLYVLMDGTASPTAVAEADATTIIPPGSSKVLRAVPVSGTRTIVLGVVGDGGKYTIEGVQ